MHLQRVAQTTVNAQTGLSPKLVQRSGISEDDFLSYGVSYGDGGKKLAGDSLR